MGKCGVQVGSQVWDTDLEPVSINMVGKLRGWSVLKHIDYEEKKASDQSMMIDPLSHCPLTLGSSSEPTGKVRKDAVQCSCFENTITWKRRNHRCRVRERTSRL